MNTSITNYILFTLTAVAAGALLAAENSPKDAIIDAAKKLGEKANYAWKTTVVVPEDAPFKPGPTEGETEKAGFTHVTTTFFENKIQAVIKGDKGAVTDQDGAWKSLEEMDKVEGPGRFVGLIMRNQKTPAKEAAEIAGFAKELKKDGEVYVSDLTEEGAKTLQTFRMRGSPSGGPEVSNAKGSVKFWIKDGLLTKYEFKLKGNIKFGDNDFPNDRTTTVEIKDVGAAKVVVPDEAKKKIN